MVKDYFSQNDNGQRLLGKMIKWLRFILVKIILTRKLFDNMIRWLRENGILVKCYIDFIALGK